MTLIGNGKKVAQMPKLHYSLPSLPDRFTYRDQCDTCGILILAERYAMRLLLGDVVAERLRDVLHGDAEIALVETDVDRFSGETLALDEDRLEPLTMISLTSASWIRCAIGLRNGRITSKLITGRLGPHHRSN
jgi:hypothetical protein